MACIKCPEAIAAEQLGLAAVLLAEEPVLGLLCVAHAREFFAARRVREAGAGAPERPRPTGLCGHPRCLADGTLYPGGRWCDQHLPPAEPWMGHGREPIHMPEQASVPPPVMRAVRCPEIDLPSTLPSVLRRAKVAGWETSCSLAIGADWTRSVATRFSRSGIAMVTTHEDGRFKSGWWCGPGGPVSLGWRAVSVVLADPDGAYPAESSTDLRTAQALVCFAFGIVA